MRVDNAKHSLLFDSPFDAVSTNSGMMLWRTLVNPILFKRAPVFFGRPYVL